MDNKNHKVYCHTNLINGKKYVGQTGKNKAEERWGYNGIQYKPSKNPKNNHGNYHFWNSIQKYGWDNFKHEILKDNLSKEEANYWEKYYIKEWDLLNPNKGYNHKEGGEGGKLSEESKMKISKNHSRYWLGRKHSEEYIFERRKNANNCKKIICIETQRIFNSMAEASREMNLSYSHITEVCNNKRKTTGGYHFEYC